MQRAVVDLEDAKDSEYEYLGLPNGSKFYGASPSRNESRATLGLARPPGIQTHRKVRINRKP